ncbi:helix-turn-helix transcriptional regulator [Streptomyces lonarensis]|uniref:helix-turn-helix domain-containing protein n=1 Tax=Streptomyces lonarensis TaxID=700599 RepID=UPI0030C69A33
MDRPDRQDRKVVPLDLARADQDAGGPVAAGKVLGTYLRRLRVDHGYLLKEVAPVIKASPAKVSRLERGESPAKRKDVLDLLEFYGVTDSEEREGIAGLLKQSGDRAWYHQFSDVMPGWLERLIGMEAAADEIRTYEMQYVPGLLQTPDYARAVVSLAFPDPSAFHIERRVELRLERQRLLQTAGAPRMVALLDEGVLMRPIGGATVMRGQLRHLQNLADTARGINIRIIPFTAAAGSTAPNAGVTYLKFPAGGPEEMVYLEQLHGARYLSSQREVEAYRQTFLLMAEAALDREGTLDRLQRAIDATRD